MPDDLPPPPVPADCDLTGMYFPLDSHIADSPEFITHSGAEFKARLTLQMQAWLQKPAGSLPPDPREIARLSMVGRHWRKIAKSVMADWFTASDGRLYHRGLVPLVLKAWAGRLRIMAKVNRRLMMESGDWATIRSKVFRRDDYTCAYCGARGVALECDHVIPLSKGGPTIEDNLVTACRRCNRSKGAKTMGEWNP